MEAGTSTNPKHNSKKRNRRRNRAQNRMGARMAERKSGKAKPGGQIRPMPGCKARTKWAKLSEGKSKKAKTVGQNCPMPGCKARTKWVKIHFQLKHLPKFFRDDSLLSFDKDSLSNMQVNSLARLVHIAFGPEVGFDYAAEYINNFGNLPANVAIPPKVVAQMTNLCRYQQWNVPENGFRLVPINSFAVLIHWRCLSLLLSSLSSRDQADFHKDGFIGFVERNDERNNLDGGGESENDSFDSFDRNLVNSLEFNMPRHSSVEEWVPITSNSHDDHIMQASSSQFLPYDEPFDHRNTMVANMGTNQIYYSDVHDDDSDDDDDHVVRRNPLRDLRLYVYSEPLCYPKTLQRDSNHVAVGVHPKFFHQFSPEKFEQLKYLMLSPNAVALGEVGLDRTVSANYWRQQEEVFRMALSTLDEGKVLILHLRGTPDDMIGMDVHARCMQILRKVCSSDQPIQLRNFTGDSELAKEWMDRYNNVYFSYTRAVGKFLNRQVGGLQSVPMNRILLEEDYADDVCDLENENVTSPWSLHGIASIMASMLEVSKQYILKETTANRRRLFRF